MKPSEIFTFSNMLSFARIFMVIPMVYYIARDDNITVLVWAIVAALSDGLDGYFARRFNQITQLGKILDPAADKVCTTGVFLALSAYQGFPWWITGIIIGRDMLIVIGSLMIIGKKHIVAPSNKPGKITVFAITVLGIAYLLHVDILYLPLTVIASALILYSGINYAIVFYKNM